MLSKWIHLSAPGAGHAIICTETDTIALAPNAIAAARVGMPSRPYVRNRDTVKPSMCKQCDSLWKA